MELAGAKFVLIGGAGLIGSHTVDSLLKEDVAELLICHSGGPSLNNLTEARRDPRVRISDRALDLLNTNRLETVLSKADGVFHFASKWLLACEETPRDAFDINVRGAFNVVEACVRTGVKRLIFSSSAAVYGAADCVPVREDQALRGTSVYAATKIAAEALIRGMNARYGLEFAALRYTNVYGPRQRWQGDHISVIMKMLNAIDDGQPPTVIGQGNETLDLISVRDCALANVFAMRSDSPAGAYNVATGSVISVRDLAQLLIELTDARLPINHVAQTPGSGRGVICCPEKAANELGFRAGVGLRDGLTELIAWRARQAPQPN